MKFKAIVYFQGTVSTNTLNSEGDNDLVFERNGTEYIKLERDSTPTDLIRMAHSVVIDNNRYLFTNNIDTTQEHS